ncbi:RNA-guided pseudouridylation complex pseudouridine synthase subunit Cbf5 [Acidianus sulfidivorans JP7]|uniref:RNA-guided pseudouridylation complex pseudouridine synthase subunit Cbf5 n=1 Tax=Acidianus sulfidivorans JP7 TaxID=619593 RepID=A0A2U9IMD0_9CREN|nr:RNA-guided pseudouridylation complex pseudouridine synthase subunit Cbf5 [Acidianus sulfidivorans]AWR97188.1 RNA-guided pseudouridylation complex pseudouridine synthase subunit Cbf5 [Acidianus sulfidivorans JP7]
MLPIGLENATKLIPYTSKAGKEYVCVMELHCDVERDHVEEVVRQFKGKIYQRPPVRSSVKRRLRIKKVDDIQIIDSEGRLYLLKISSDPGTYMRKICHDIGIILGCGAHMRELRRVRSGIFSEKDLVTLQDVSEALYMWRNCKDESDLRKILMPMEIGLCGIPKIIVDDNTVDAISYGAPLHSPGVVAYQEFKKGDMVGIITLKGEAVGLGIAKYDSDQMPEKGEVVSTKRVLIERDLYPRAWKK